MPQTGDEIYLNYNDALRKPPIPFRYFIFIFLFTATATVNAVRNVINVAILAMVGSKSTNETLTQLPIEHFNWNQKDQGFVLGAYFYTYTAIQIGAGALADKFNVVHLFAGSQLIAALCTLLSPAAARTGINYFIGLRMIIGLVHGVTFPTLYNLIEKWFKPTEIGLAQGLMAAGCDFGTALTMTFSAWISQRNLWGGWPAAFYIIGMINFGFLITLIIMVTKDPQSNRFVSDYEKRQLSRSCNTKQTNRPKKSTPWIKLLTSLPLWSVIIAKGFIGLAYSVINTKIPVYLSSVHGFDIENNGAINAMFYIANGSSQLICGPVSNYIISKGWLPKIIVRKLFESIALSGIMASLITICYSGDNVQLIVACLVIAMFSYGFNLGGDVPIIPELAPAFVGSAFGVSNTLACASGFIAPALVGAILGDDAGSRSEWTFSFKIVIFFQFVALIMFGIFATPEPQSWAKLEDDESEPPKSIETISENLNRG